MCCCEGLREQPAGLLLHHLSDNLLYNTVCALVMVQASSPVRLFLDCCLIIKPCTSSSPNSSQSRIIRTDSERSAAAAFNRHCTPNSFILSTLLPDLSSVTCSRFILSNPFSNSFKRYIDVVFMLCGRHTYQVLSIQQLRSTSTYMNATVNIV